MREIIFKTLEFVLRSLWRGAGKLTLFLSRLFVSVNLKHYSVERREE